MTTKKTSTTAAKPKKATPAKPAARAGSSKIPAPKPKVAKPVAPTPPTAKSGAVVSPVKRAAPVAAGGTDSAKSDDLKKQELLSKVVEKTGVKKKDAKQVVEAMLEILGEAVADERELNLQPFGKLKYNRVQDTDAARVIVAKIRQPKAGGDKAKPAVADPAKAS